MLDRFRDFIEKENLFQPGQKILLAVSGGVDSIVMTDLFYRTGYRFGIAHCNFQLRGIDADQDEKLIEELAENLDVPFYVKRFDTAKYAKKNKVSVQMAARELRYNFFEELLDKYKYTCVATAHHLDDQIETFFINLLRGTGVSGLKGINVKNERRIRPLLFAGKEEIETYCHRKLLSYRNDKSNRSTVYLRNKIRHKLLPALSEISSDYRQVFSNNFNHIRNIEKVYQNTIRFLRTSVLEESEDGTCKISIDTLFKMSPLDSLLYEILSPFNFKLDVINQLIDSLDDIPGKTFYSESHRILKDRDDLIISKLKSNTKKDFYIPDGEIEIKNPVKLKITLEPHDENFVLPIVSEIACLDYDKLDFPLVLRKWKEGDVFQPLGMKGKKKVSDFFTDQKFSLTRKESTWILISGENIAWIIGHRIDEGFKITANTRKVYCIQFIK